MILGTSGRGYFGYHYGPWAGRRRRDGCSARSAALLHALATVTFGVDHIVSGVAINIIAVGVAAFLADAVVLRAARAAARPSPRRSTARPSLDLPGRRGLGQDRRGQALVPGLRPRRRCSAALTTRPVARSRSSSRAAGRRRRTSSSGGRRSACGCAPAARARAPPSRWASTSTATSIIAVLVSGALAGLAGGFLVLVGAGLYQNGRPTAAATSASPR